MHEGHASDPPLVSKKPPRNPAENSTVPPRVVPHGDFEGLLDAFISSTRTREPSPRPLPVIVPSIPFSDHLQRRVADLTGICMGFDFIMPQTFLGRIIHADAKRRDSDWSKRRMVWRIFPHVRDYEERLGLRDSSCRDRLALAGLLADRMDQYAHYRPGMIRAWAAGRSGLPENASAEDRANEAWQRELWKTLRDGTDEPHPALQTEKLLRDKKQLAALRERYPRLVVVGTGSIDPLLVEILQLLEKAGSVIEVHVLLPSLHFLGDLNRTKRLPAAETGPEDFASEAGHDLLASMGRHSIGSFVLLGKLDEQYQGWDALPEEENGAADGSLFRLQADIRALRAPQVAEPKLSADDASLRIHACYGLRRETETIRDEILRAFREIPDLKPDEVHIVAPSLETYRPLVPAVLRAATGGTGRGLPVRLTELAPSEGDAVTEGLLALLEMARVGRYETSNVLELLPLRAVQAALGIDGDDKLLELVRGWIKQSGTTSGLGPETEQGSWSNGRSRLVAGRWFGTGAALYVDRRHILPVADALGGEPELMERFIQWHGDLERLMQEWQKPVEPSQWDKRLLEACRLLLGAGDDARIEAQAYLDLLGSAGCDEPLDAGAIGDWLADESGERAHRGANWGGITFGRIKQLQHIPCRVLVLAGMQDAAFPGAHKAPAWDLLRCDPRVWDRNARVDDRQLFLDALLTPTDRLVVTAAVRNPRTLKERPFSSCVDELLRVLGQMGAERDDVVVKHPLQPFSPRYFGAAGAVPSGDAKADREPPPTFDHGARVLAGELAAKEKPDPVPLYDKTPDNDPEEFSVLEIPNLVRFWKDPAKAYLAAQDIAVEGDEERDEDLDRFPLDMDSLQRWSMKNAIIREIVYGNGDLERVAAELRGRRLLAPGHLATDLDSPYFRKTIDLAKKLAAAAGESQPLRIHAGEGGPVVTGNMLLSKDGGHILAWRPGSVEHVGHYFDPWITAVVAACSGCTLPTLVFREGAPPVARDPIPRDEALIHLGHIVGGYAAGRLRPLTYAARLSHEHGKILREGDSTGREALEGAMEKANWLRSYMPGLLPGALEPAFSMAWRDRDPYAEDEEWEKWTRTIAIPLHVWGKFK